MFAICMTIMSGTASMPLITHMLHATSCNYVALNLSVSRPNPKKEAATTALQLNGQSIRLAAQDQPSPWLVQKFRALRRLDELSAQGKVFNMWISVLAVGDTLPRSGQALDGLDLHTACSSCSSTGASRLPRSSLVSCRLCSAPVQTSGLLDVFVSTSHLCTCEVIHSLEGNEVDKRLSDCAGDCSVTMLHRLLHQRECVVGSDENSNHSW